MSISNPQKNPTHIPSFLPRINPKEETAIIKRLGEIFAKVNALNTVVCSKKHMHIIKNRVTLRLIYISNPI